MLRRNAWYQAATMLTISSLTYRIAGRTLFDEASATIAAGQHIGLVGRNGTGKSTLFELILGHLQPDGGKIEMQAGAKIGIVAQEAPGGDATPLQVVLAAHLEIAALQAEADQAEHGHADPHRVAEIHARLYELDAHSAPSRAAIILSGLGFDEAMQNREMSSFSGGWRMRVALAAALFSEPDLLLLDEPTNHLDLEASIWLENYLKAYPNTYVLISHDRHILNTVVDRILHIDAGKLVSYTGGYDAFESAREERFLQNKAAAAKQEARRQHLQSFVDRFRAQATKARQAQSRLKMLARLTPIAQLAEDPSMSLDFPDPPALSPPLISFDNVSVGYLPGKPVLRSIDIRLDPSDRIALLGANGNGKSTFAKLLAGRLQPMGGQQFRTGKLRTGFFAQHQIEDMNGEETPFRHMLDLMPGATETAIRSRLGRFGFSREKAFVKVKELSGGERARLNFALVTHDAPPVLILDEPTNHLDIDSRRALAEAINGYTGAVVLISHDWSLLELTADRLLLVADGKVQPFDGDLEDYRKYMLKGAGGGKADPARGKQAGGERRRNLEPLRKAAKEAEALLQKLTLEKARIEAELGKAILPVPRRIDLTRQLADVAARIAAAEEAWLEAADALEQAAA